MASPVSWLVGVARDPASGKVVRFIRRLSRFVADPALPGLTPANLDCGMRVIEVYAQKFELDNERPHDFYSEMSDRDRWFADLHLQVTGGPALVLAAIDVAARYRQRKLMMARDFALRFVPAVCRRRNTGGSP